MNSGSPNAYLRTRVLTASPEQLRLLLIEGATKFARQAREGLEAKDHEGAYLGFTQCRNILVELMTTLRDDVAPELCAKVRSLYAFLYQELIEANMARDLARVDRVIELLEFERESWVLAMQKLDVERSGGVTPGALPQPAGAAPAAQRSISVQA